MLRIATEEAGRAQIHKHFMNLNAYSLCASEKEHIPGESERDRGWSAGEQRALA